MKRKTSSRKIEVHIHLEQEKSPWLNEPRAIVIASVIGLISAIIIKLI